MKTPSIRRLEIAALAWVTAGCISGLGAEVKDLPNQPPARAGSPARPAAKAPAARAMAGVTISKAPQMVTFPEDGNMGQKIYSTGVEDVLVTLLAGQEGLGNKLYYQAVGQSEKFIANSIPWDPVGGRVYNLGRLPRGEIVFRIDLMEKYYSGPATRNPDGMPHASVIKVGPGQILRVYFHPDPRRSRLPATTSRRSIGETKNAPFKDLTVDVAPGEIAVGFEDQPGGPDQSDSDYDDVTFKLTGGVTINDALIQLMEIYETAKGEARDAAGFAITQSDPVLARKMGVVVSPEFARQNTLTKR